MYFDLEVDLEMRVLVLGANGMLGSQVVETMKLNEIELYWTKRKIEATNELQYRFNIDDLGQLISRIPNLGYVINCIGAIPQRNSNPENFRINWELPNLLETLSRKFNFKVIQIATDCAFDGSRGKYSESDLPDAKDSYGASKVLGEVSSANFMHIRCSIIGNDNEGSSLYSWLLSHKENSIVSGYTNHFWNGVTTLSFAKIVNGIVLNNKFTPGTYHLVPSSSVTKYELLGLISRSENRQDLSVLPYETHKKIDRTLTTTNLSFNADLWEYGGYDFVPSVKDLVHEFATLNGEKRQRL